MADSRVVPGAAPDASMVPLTVRAPPSTDTVAVRLDAVADHGRALDIEAAGIEQTALRQERIERGEIGAAHARGGSAEVTAAVVVRGAATRRPPNRTVPLPALILIDPAAWWRTHRSPNRRPA